MFKLRKSFLLKSRIKPQTSDGINGKNAGNFKIREKFSLPYKKGPSANWQLDVSDPVRVRQGRRQVRVSGEHRAQDQQVLPVEGHHTQGKCQLRETFSETYNL